jgi:hypothetical protein
VHFKLSPKGETISSIRSVYPKNSPSVLQCIEGEHATYYYNAKAWDWIHRIAGSNSPRAWTQLQATSNVKTNEDAVKPPGELQFATRRAKFKGAKREGASKEETVAAAFEALHAEPEKRLQLFKKIRRPSSR